MTRPTKVYRIEYPDGVLCGCPEHGQARGNWHTCFAVLAVFTNDGWTGGRDGTVPFIMPDFELCDCPSGREEAINIVKAAIEREAPL